MFTDTHAHILKEYYEDISSIINNAKSAGVNRIISDADNVASSKELIETSKHYDNLYITLGIHPQNIDEDLDEFKKILIENLDNDKVIAIGEIGLDYYYGKEDREKQTELFEFQLKLAEEYNLPVVVHSREATLDTINILKKHNVKGVIHCFSGSYETAMEYIKMGFMIGVGGVITFKNANIKDVIEKLPLESILLETDAPYLAPVPYRGKTNEPAYMIETAKFVSNIKNVSLEELSSITNQNIFKIFNI